MTIARVALLSGIGAAALLGSFSLGFFAGFENGKGAMDRFCGIVIEGSHAGARVDLLALHFAALNALRGGDLPGTENTLRFLAKSDAQQIIECKKRAECLQVMGHPPPDEAILQDAVSAKISPISLGPMSPQAH